MLLYQEDLQHVNSKQGFQSVLASRQVVTHHTSIYMHVRTHRVLTVCTLVCTGDCDCASVQRS